MGICIKVAAGFVVAALVGCAAPPIQLGDKDTERALKQLQPISGRVSVYVCRVEGEHLARTIVVVDEKPVAGLHPRTFAHTTVDPGSHTVRLDTKRPGIMHSLYGGGALNFDAKAGDVLFFWIGVTGGGFGVLTIDKFDSETAAKSCMQNAQYAIQAPQ